MAAGTNIAERIADIKNSKAKINARLVDLGVALEEDDLATMATKIEKNIINQGSVSATVVEGQTYTIPKGYHNGSGTVTGLSDTMGDSEKYKLQSKTVTPTKNEINVTPDSGYYGISDVTVNPIPSAYQDVTAVTAGAADVLTGKTIVAKDGTVTAGTMTNNGAVAKTLDTTTTSYTVPKGYHNGSGTVAINLEEKSATPTKESQSVTPSAGKVLSSVTINPIPDQFVDVTDTDAAASNILVGKTAAINAGTEAEPDYKVVEGTMKDNGTVLISLNPVNKSYTIPNGYHNGAGQVTVTAIDAGEITPTKDPQAFGSPSEYYSGFTVAAIPDEYITTDDATATADEILFGETAYVKGAKVTGTMVSYSPGADVIDVGNPLFTIPKGYHGGAGIVQIVTETKSATPTKSAQTINATSGKVISSVTVAAIPDAYQDVTGVTATADKVLTGSKYVASDGKLTSGTMTNNGAVTATIDGLTAATSTYTIPAGYHNGSGTVSLTSAIENLLAEI